MSDTIAKLRELLLQQSKTGRLRGLLDSIYGAASTGAEAYGAANSPMSAEHSGLLGGLLMDMSPLGDAKSAYEGVQAARDGDWVGAGLGGLGALPMVPNLGGTIKKMSPVDNEIKTAIQYWTSSAPMPKAERDAALAELNRALSDPLMSVNDKHKLAYNFSAKAQKYNPSSGNFGAIPEYSAIGKALSDPSKILSKSLLDRGSANLGGYRFQTDPSAKFKYVEINDDQGRYIGAIPYDNGVDQMESGIRSFLKESQ